MKKLYEKLVEAEKDGHEVYEVTYLERRMTERHWDEIQKRLGIMAKAALKKQGA